MRNEFPVVEKQLHEYLILTAVSILGVFFGACLITNGTFDFLAVEKFGLTYNHYLLSILDGRLDIPPDTLGPEAFYGYDGRAYSYYGVLPALLRLPFMPFLDLATQGTSRIVILVCSVLTALVCQSFLWDLVKSRAVAGVKHFHLVAVGSVMIWFASPMTFLNGNGSVYHDPFALGLLLSMLYIILFLRDVLIEGRSRPYRVLLLALLAGLVLHCRPTMAVGLYLCTSFICLFYAWDGYKTRRVRGDGVCSSAFGALLNPDTVLGPMLVMFLFGCLILFMNWVRWGNIFTLAPIERYGFYLQGEGASGRIHALVDLGHFNIRRIIPSTIFHLFGVGPTLAPSFYEKLMDVFGTETMRVEITAPIAALWGPWFIMSIWSLFLGRSRALAGQVRRMMWVFVSAQFIGTVLLLCYPTITLRYNIELWPILFVGFCFFAMEAAHAPIRLWERRPVRQLFYLGVAGVVVVNILLAMKYRLAWVSTASDMRHYKELLATVPGLLQLLGG